VNGAIGAHGQARPEGLLGPLRPEGDRHHLALPALLLDPQGLLDGELVVGGDDPRDAGGVDAPAVAADLHLGRGVGHLLDRADDFPDPGSPGRSPASVAALPRISCLMRPLPLRFTLYISRSAVLISIWTESGGSRHVTTPMLKVTGQFRWRAMSVRLSCTLP